MMSARIVADSVSSKTGDRLTTFELVYPRFIHSELMTHTVFAKNSASSRAISFDKQLVEYATNPAKPVSFPFEKAGMSGGEEMDGVDRARVDNLLWQIQHSTVRHMHNYLDQVAYAYPDDAVKQHRLHKSVLARYLEPMLWQKTILTGSVFENFFELRCSEFAQPEIHKLADLMREAYSTSVPEALNPGSWHTPFHSDILVSAGRCARVSYRSESDDPDKDIQLSLKLIEQRHMSPFEHIARPVPENVAYPEIRNRNGDVLGQLRVPVYGKYAGWQTLRTEIECVENMVTYR